MKRVLLMVGALWIGFGTSAGAQECTGANVCPEPADPCLARACIKPEDSHRGTCGVVPRAAGTSCGDPSVSECGAADTCDGNGACVVNFVPEGEPCGNDSASECDATDTCDGAGACVANHEADDVACEGAVCTAGETCQAGACSGGTPIEGCCLEDADCDNQVACDGVETCVEHTCAAGETVACDDGDSCTVDGCQEPDASCSNTLVALDLTDVPSVICNVEAMLEGAGL